MERKMLLASATEVTSRQPGMTSLQRSRRGRQEPEMSWEDRAACAGTDGQVFFAPDGEREPAREIREARAAAICAPCPVRAECLDHALRNSVKHGIWGGLNKDERARERRRRARQLRAA
jgi:WhiB family redox-sensing transcriptional regulator